MNDASRRPRRGREGARPGGEPRRRRGQHHRGPLRAGRRRRSRPASRTSGRASSCSPPDDEDTLHPEDGVAPPPPAAAEPPAPADTMVVAAADLQAAIAAQSPEPPQAGIGRRLLALAVIAVADRRDRRARLVGARALTLSYRNRELVYLAVVGVLTGDRLRVGLHRPPVARQLGLARLRRLLLRALHRGAHRRAPDGPERRPVPAADGRAPDRDRRDRDLPARRRATRSSKGSGS